MERGISGRRVRNPRIDGEHRYCVYRHTVPDGRKYIGITSREDPEDRWLNGNGYWDNKEFWNVIQTCGWNRVTHEILSVGLTVSEALTMECELIAKENTMWPKGFNQVGGRKPKRLTDQFQWSTAAHYRILEWLYQKGITAEDVAEVVIVGLGELEIVKKDGERFCVGWNENTGEVEDVRKHRASKEEKSA